MTSYSIIPSNKYSRVRACFEHSNFFKVKLPASFVDPGCLSWIQDPDFYPFWIPDPRSRIPDPKTATKERGEKKLVVIPFI
jgi:hypothetical protein